MSPLLPPCPLFTDGPSSTSLSHSHALRSYGLVQKFLRFLCVAFGFDLVLPFLQRDAYVRNQFAGVKRLQTSQIV